jgi:N-acetylneuraminic acid mutarotase
MKKKNQLRLHVFLQLIIVSFLLVAFNGAVRAGDETETQQATASHGKWIWVSGDSTSNKRGIYGTKGVAAAKNKPGARCRSVSWIDSKGNLWLFGGYGINDKGIQGELNDLWKFDGTNWTWVSGDSTVGQFGVYGTKGVASAKNKPGAREGSICWVDSKDNLWLFGGTGHINSETFGEDLNDLWKFDGANWIWISGDNTPDKPGVYGTKGVAAKSNKPGARSDSIGWIDSQDNLWLFGGRMRPDDHITYYYNDLWKFDGANWIWMSGAKFEYESGVYGVKGVTADTNKPGARFGSNNWINNKDNLWLFGGECGDISEDHENPISWFLINDLWKFDGANWIWMSGDEIRDQSGVYGIKNVANTTNKPGARYKGVSGIDKNGNLWLFGGRGYDSEAKLGELNDLWKFNGITWIWVSGDNTMKQPGIFGTKGVASINNKPGSRWESVSWIDSKGNIWLFGGEGLDKTGTSGYLNDLWRFEQ